MPQQELADALQTVHRELADADHLDDEEVAKLRATLAEIEAVLEERGDRGGLSERVSRTADRFERSHPILTETLGRVADILQQMGI